MHGELPEYAFKQHRSMTVSSIRFVRTSFANFSVSRFSDSNVLHSKVIYVALTKRRHNGEDQGGIPASRVRRRTTSASYYPATKKKENLTRANISRTEPVKPVSAHFLCHSGVAEYDFSPSLLCVILELEAISSVISFKQVTKKW